MTTITVSDAFELILESLESYVLCAGTLSGKFERSKGSVMNRELREMDEFISDFEKLYQKWLALAVKEKGGHLGKLPTLAGLGTRTPEFDYENPIIETLIQFEGRGDYDEVIEEVGNTLDLTGSDEERTPTYPFNPRWSVAAFNAILQMVNRDLIREEDDGFLILTEKGREAYARYYEGKE